MMVNVVLAVEVMWVHFFVVHTFDLDCSSKESIFAATQISDGG